MKNNVFEEAYREFDECDGGCAGGDCAAAGEAGGMIGTEDVLGPCHHDKEMGYMGDGCFHIPGKVMPLQKRYEIPSKKKKGHKNPYVKGATVIGSLTEGKDVDFPETIAEADSDYYMGIAKLEFDKVIGGQADVKTDVLYFNGTLKLAWMVRPSGQLDMYKPVNFGDYWTIYATTLDQSGDVTFNYKGGKYPDENKAVDAIYRAAEKHKTALEERLNILRESAGEFEKIEDIAGFLAGEKPVWKKVWKFQRLNARRSDGGEKIKTVGSDGNVETERETKSGDWIVNNVSNPDNKWIIDAKTFGKKYEPAGEDGVYKPKGGEMLACAVSDVVDSGVEFAPPNWGGDVIKIAADGYFMKDPSNESDIYAISKKDFDATYSYKRPLSETKIVFDAKAVKLTPDEVGAAKGKQTVLVVRPSEETLDLLPGDIVKTGKDQFYRIQTKTYLGGCEAEAGDKGDVMLVLAEIDQKLDETRFSPRDIMNWEAHGRDPKYFPSGRNDVNTHALAAELKQKFHGQFEDVRLREMGGMWKVEFSVNDIGDRIVGQQRVKTVIPRIDDIVRLLRIRGVETMQYDITAVPA